MPDSAILKLVFSAGILLQNQRVPRNEAFAAGAAAAVIPGLGGLAVPLLVARQPRYLPVSGISPVAVSTSTVAVVPNVINMEKSAAEQAIIANKLKPVSESRFIQGGTVPKGFVEDQDPKSGSGLVRPGTEVNLTVSLGPPPSATEEESIHQRIEQDVEAAQQQILVAQNQIMDAKATIIEAKETILAAIAAKGTSQSGGAPEKK